MYDSHGKFKGIPLFQSNFSAFDFADPFFLLTFLYMFCSSRCIFFRVILFNVFLNNFLNFAFNFFWSRFHVKIYINIIAISIIKVVFIFRNIRNLNCRSGILINDMFFSSKNTYKKKACFGSLFSARGSIQNDSVHKGVLKYWCVYKLLKPCAHMFKKNISRILQKMSVLNSCILHYQVK